MTTPLLGDLARAFAANALPLLLLAKATLLLVLAFALTLVMRRAAADARHLVWLVTLGAMLVLPVLSVWGPWQLAVLPAAQATREAGVTYEQVTGLTGSTGDADAALAASAPDAFPDRPVVTRQTRDDARAEFTSQGLVTRAAAMLAAASPLALAAGVWAAVMAAILAWLAVGAWQVRRIVRRGEPLGGPSWTGPLYEIADRLALAEPPVLVRSADTPMPFACGLRQPTIVLPHDCEAWSLDRRRAVLLHELAHVKRRDLAGHTLGRVACAAWWFHPLAWSAARRLRAESERACDDMALASGARPSDYAEHLLDIVTSVRVDRTPAVALAMARRKEFEGRMLAILDHEPQPRRSGRRAASLLAGALGAVALLVGAASPVRRVDAAPSLGTGLTVAVSRTTQIVPVAAPRIGHSALTSVVPASRQRADSDRIGAPVAGVVTSVVTNVVPNVVTSVLTSRFPQDDTKTPKQRAWEQGLDRQVDRQVDRALDGTAVRREAPLPDDRPALLAKVLATDTSASLRRIAAWGLAEHLEAGVAESALVVAVRRDASASVREMAAWSLSNANDGHAATVRALGDALRKDGDARVRATAAWALGDIGDRDATGDLVAALADSSRSVRMRAAWALGNVEPRTAPAPLVALLKDPEPRVRQLAAWALYQIEDPGAVPALQAALNGEKDRDLQVAYIRALAATGEKSVDAIKGLLESSDPEVRKMAVRALAGGQATGPWPWPWPEPRPFPGS